MAIRYRAWSGKHSVPANGVQIICAPTRRVLYVSHTYMGAANDIAAWRSMRMSHYPGEFFSPGEFMLADGGYPPHTHLRRPINSAPGITLLDGLHDTAVRRYRTIVEYVIGAAKSRWRLLGRPEQPPPYRIWR